MGRQRLPIYGSKMDIVLMAGLWLPSSVWADVAAELEALGHRGRVVDLPGVDDGAIEATLEDQLRAALAIVDSSDRPLVVGHSAASALAWLVADRRPSSIAGTVMIGGFPTSGRSRYADFFEIVDGVMQDPTGPWIVSWYQETPKAGGDGNTVMAGHIDYWNVGPAVFYNISDLVDGDTIEVFGEDNRIYSYRVNWVREYHVDELTSDTIQEIVGPTTQRSLTLITCGGEFDYASGEYLSRTAVRAHFSGSQSA